MKYQAVIKIRNSVRGGKQIGQSYTSELLKYPELCLVQVCALTLPCPYLQMPYLFKAQLKHHIPPQVARLLHPPTLRTNLLEDAGVLTHTPRVLPSVLTSGFRLLVAVCLQLGAFSKPGERCCAPLPGGPERQRSSCSPSGPLCSCMERVSHYALQWEVL